MSYPNPPPPDEGQQDFFQGRQSFPPRQSPYPPEPPSDQDYFTPSRPMGNGKAAPQKVSNVPPAYQGPLTMPQQADPFSQFPQYPLSPGGTGGPVPPGNRPPAGQEAPDRVPYQAPPRQKSLMVYLYIGLAILVIILGVMGLNQLLNNQGARTAIVTISQQNSAYSGNALIVRDETVYTQEGVTDILYLAGENETVMRGDAICTVYTAGFSSREFSQLASYRKQIKEYLKILRSLSDSPDTRLQLLENTIFDRAIETRALVQGMQGNLLNQESLLKEAITSRYDYLKQKYPDDTKLTRLYDSEKTQMQRIDTWTKQYTAGDSGIVSFYTDGFENALNLDTYENYSPQEVRAMYNGRIPTTFEKGRDSRDIYRLIRPYQWTVLMLADDLKWNPAIGDTYRIMIESFDNTTVSGIVSSVTRSGGDLLVRLTVESPVEPVLNIRTCHVQLSTSIITYEVPNSAIVSKEGVMGVVVQFREGLFIVPVTIVSQDATQTYVIPQNPGHLYEGLSVQLNPQQQAQRQQQEQQNQNTP